MCTLCPADIHDYQLNYCWKWRLSAILDLLYVCSEYTRMVYYVVQNLAGWNNRQSSIENMQIRILCKFDLKCIFTPPSKNNLIPKWAAVSSRPQATSLRNPAWCLDRLDTTCRSRDDLAATVMLNFNSSLCLHTKYDWNVLNRFWE